jgi:aspartyl protease family protein
MVANALRAAAARLAVCALVGRFFLFASTPAAWAAADLRATLEDLSRQHRFLLEGSDHLVSGEAVDEALPADIRPRLARLLHRYNYLVVSSSDRAIERVVVIGVKHDGHFVAPTNSVKITRDGMHHRVDAVLTGANGHEVTTSLIIDTGASNVVLPASMIEALGFRAADLKQATSQSASGPLPVRVGTLRSVDLGGNRAAEVSVSFVDDQKLGDLRLLGMSFLGRFRVTIDDERESLTLIER